MTNQVDANDRRVRYVWTTGAQVFDYDFPLSDVDNIAVYINTNDTAEDPAHYTVDLVAKTVTYTGSSFTNPTTIVLEGLETLTRTDGYPLRGGLPSSLLNEDVNNIYYALQEMRRDIDRSLVLVKSAPNTVNPTIPAPVANAVIVGNSDATGFTTGPLTTDVSAVALHLTEIDAVSGDLTNINTVAGDVTNINIVAGAAADVVAVGSAIAGVSAVAGDLASVDAVAGDLTNINTVAGISGNVTTVAGISANVTTVAGDHTAINTVSGDHTAINTVAGDHAAIVAVNADLTNVNTVSGIAANVTTVAGVSGNVTTVAGISGNVTTVAGISANVTTVAGDHTAINTVSGDHTAINTVAGDHAAIVAVNADLTNINLVAADLTNIDTCATNLAAINAAPAAATSAAASAAAASAAAAGISMKSSCRGASTGALTVTYANGTSGVGATLTNAGAQAAFAIDGITGAVNDRYLIKDQASAFQNGIYSLTTIGSGATNWVLTRTTDYDQAAEIIEGTATIISEGTTNASHIYVMTQNAAVTVGTTAINFTALTANATTANALTTPRAIGGVNFDGSAAITPQQIQPASEASDTTCFPAFFNAASGTAQQPKYNANFGYDASGNALTGTVAWKAAQVAEVFGGTNQTTYTKGDFLFASATNTLSKLGIGSAGQIIGVAAGVPAWVAGTLGDMNYNPQASTYAPVASDLGAWLPFTGSSGATWTMTAAATLGAGWWAILQNSGTSNANLTLASSGGTIDGLSGYIMYPGEARLIRCDGTNFQSFVLNGFNAKFTSSGSFKVPPGYKTFGVDIWDGGASGAARLTTGNADGGYGGSYNGLVIQASNFVAAGSTETITVAAAVAGVSGNTAGTAGNHSNITVNGVTLTTSTNAVAPSSVAISTVTTGGQANQWFGFNSYDLSSWGGSGGGVTVGNVPGGNSLGYPQQSKFGGGGGGGCSSTAGGVRTGGASMNGGNGGAGGANTGGAGTTGSFPGGGGGAAVQGGTSGGGAAGQVIIRGIV